MKASERFTPEQLTAMMLTKLKQITNDDIKSKATDCVIAVRRTKMNRNKSMMFLFKVPCFYTDAERRAMLDAAFIADWKCLRLLNETTAGKTIDIVVLLGLFIKYVV